MIKIFPTIQIKELDAYTIENEPIASIDLMERASQALAKAISERWGAETLYGICRPRQQWGRRAGCFASAGRAGISGGGISL